MNVSELEQRLRAAYDATNDLDVPLAAASTEQISGKAADARPAQRRQWWVPALAATAVLAIAFGTYAAVHLSGRTAGGPSSAAAHQSTARPAQTTVHAANSRSAPSPLPAGIPPQVGVSYTFQWYVHCGMDYAEFGGRSWRAQPPRQPFPGNKPSPGGGGADNGYLPGTMTLIDHNTLRFDANPTAVVKPFHVIFKAITPTKTGQPVCA